MQQLLRRGARAGRARGRNCNGPQEDLDRTEQLDEILLTHAPGYSDARAAGPGWNGLAHNRALTPALFDSRPRPARCLLCLPTPRLDSSSPWAIRDSVRWPFRKAIVLRQTFHVSAFRHLVR